MTNLGHVDPPVDPLAVPQGARGIAASADAADGVPRASTLALLVAIAASFVFLRIAVADNAAFALAPRNASIAIDARCASDVLGVGGAAMRPVLESIAGAQALATFDVLARRSNAQADAAVREVFAGRVVFYLTEAPDGSYAWLFGVQADDARCERVLKMLGAKMSAPQRFVSSTQNLFFRRVGGWLLIAPAAQGEPWLEGAAARAATEDAATSLLGEPLIQDFLASDAPVRMFMRHGAPVGGATLVALTRVGEALRAEVRGTYDESPLGIGSRPRGLDAPAVRALEPVAMLALSNPSDGLPTASDAFWMALVPELKLSPAMRANLAGERLVAVGPSSDPARPAMAVAWRVEDATQGEADQDAYMHSVCCGLLRAAELPPPKQGEFQPVASHAERLRAVSRQLADPAESARRECDALGPFIDRYLGTSFKLGGSGLSWQTVATPCGGWQVYASDKEWLTLVAKTLAVSSCAADGESPATGVGFCDGPRAAAMVRRWKPLVVDGAKGADRISRGLEAIAKTIEGLGRLRFRYQTPAAHRLEAVVDIEPALRPAAAPTVTRPTLTPGPSNATQQRGTTP